MQMVRCGAGEIELDETMTTKEKMMKGHSGHYGTISCPLYDQSCYARISVPQGDGPPLAIKATFQDFPRGLLTKGTVVYVTRTDKNDARRYKVSMVLGVHTNDRDLSFVRGYAESAASESVCEDQKPTDAIEFFLQKRYFQKQRTTNGFHRGAMSKVLCNAFGISSDEAEHMMRKNPNGFRIVCTPEQFANFIISRCSIGTGVNGIRDLEAAYIDRRASTGRIDVTGN